ncbi:Os11g0272250 [Oryza sativa Japonica Group]|uniref:Os11g0272250 protein n=1 Tax=Oryza sativa subsp. japonica TaxID=39947 RepID=A0A0P0Y1N5_ORYSJ|nr:Os11g0272250 [Oryza sativa Japonica Group]
MDFVTVWTAQYITSLNDAHDTTCNAIRKSEGLVKVVNRIFAQGSKRDNYYESHTIHKDERTRSYLAGKSAGK